MTDIILISVIICILCRCIIFNKLDLKWWKGLIPFINKYKIGKFIKNRVIGAINGVIFIIFFIYIVFYLGLELYVLQNYATQVKVPVDESGLVEVQLVIPTEIANMMTGSRVVFLVLLIITTIFWAIMMWKFTMNQKRNPWFILLWVILPPIAYIYFATTSIVYIEGKKYKIKKVEI